MTNRTIRVDPTKPDISAISDVVNLVKKNGVIVYPTDTVYGLGSNALNHDAVLRIFKIKERFQDQPLPVGVASLEMAERLAFVDDCAKRLIDAFWPGALTIVLEKRSVLPSVVVGGGLSVGLRMPNHAVPLMIMKMAGLPIIATSANKHGKLEPLEADEARRQIGDEVDLILDCGKVRGQPSTIIDLTKNPPVILRSGSITREMIAKIISLTEY